MYKGIFSAVSLIALLVFSVLARATEPKDCKLTKYASLDLLELRNGTLLVPVTIQNSPAFMVLNTANAFSTLTQGTADRLALQVKQMPFAGKVRSGSVAIDKAVTVSGFALGTARFNTAEFMIIPSGSIHTNPGDVEVSGILGMDVFSHVDIELDLANHKMNLFSPDHCKGAAVYWSNTFDAVPIRFGQLGEFYFPMELDGKKLEATLATGNSTTTLSTDVTRKLFNFDRHSPDVETESNGAGGTTASYRAMRLSGEGVQVVNAHIMLIDRPLNDACYLSSRSGAAAYDGCFGIHPLQLGRNVLIKLHLYIATKEKLLYFTPAGVSDHS